MLIVTINTLPRLFKKAMRLLETHDRHSKTAASLPSPQPPDKINFSGRKIKILPLVSSHDHLRLCFNINIPHCLHYLLQTRISLSLNEFTLFLVLVFRPTTKQASISRLLYTNIIYRAQVSDTITIQVSGIIEMTICLMQLRQIANPDPTKIFMGTARYSLALYLRVTTPLYDTTYIRLHHSHR
jgi:hypothetical protein